MNQSGELIRLLKDQFGEQIVTGIEIGTGPGTITTAILSLPNVTLLYTIDPYRHVPGAQYEAGSHNQEQHNGAMLHAINRLKPHRGRFIMCLCTSDKAVEFTASEVDFVWIDGHHTVEQVDHDVRNYWPKVKSGGFIGGHDFGHAGDVRQAVYDIFDPSEVELGEDTTWWVFKK